MNFVPKLIVVLLVLFLFASCATVVTFDVEHPPLVDLRGANTITVIPFEWNSVREQAWLANRVTAALMDGLRRGNIDIVDPYMLEYSRGRNYSQYADAYIIGRIINVNAYDQVDTQNETDNYQTIIREVITRTAVVDIEYSYIRSADNKTLGNFKKREMATTSFERIRYREENTGRNTTRDTARRGTGRGAGQSRSAFPQRGTWQEGAAASAIAQFSDTMNQELGPWTTTESRNIKKRTGDNTLAAEARYFIERNRYDEAIVLYKTIYEQNGNISAGYNAAILLAANEQFTGALGLLERLGERRLKEGKTVPAFIKNEMKIISEIINGSRVLEAYKGSETKIVSDAFISTATAAAAAAVATATGREITGTVNLNSAIVYALNGSISSIDDNSIFPKMVAYADVVDGLWSMRIPDTAPAAVWLLVTDGRRDYYITKTAVNISGSIALNTAEMIKLTN
jgi:hypothetical protein